MPWRKRGGMPTQQAPSVKARQYLAIRCKACAGLRRTGRPPSAVSTSPRAKRPGPRPSRTLLERVAPRSAAVQT